MGFANLDCYGKDAGKDIGARGAYLMNQASLTPIPKEEMQIATTMYMLDRCVRASERFLEHG